VTLTTAAFGAGKHKTAIVVESHVHVQGDHEEIETGMEQKRQENHTRRADHARMESKRLHCQKDYIVKLGKVCKQQNN
jgi:hypothetical protein